jgi:ssDNA-binding replication factor A large subunit
MTKDDDFWSDEDLQEEPDEETDEKDVKFYKISELKTGMEGVSVTATIDFVGNTMGKEYGEEPFAMGFLKDATGEIKVTFWGEDIKKAKKGKKVKILDGYVSEFKGQIQLNCKRKKGIEFV